MTDSFRRLLQLSAGALARKLIASLALFTRRPFPDGAHEVPRRYIELFEVGRDASRTAILARLLRGS